mgnify:CR=1 FL=1|jgi:hypothetical protein
MTLCKYSKLFGETGKGLHSYRIFNIAIIDVVMTFIGAYLLQLFIFKNTSYYIIVICLFIVGIILHRLFCVRTTIDLLLFK